MSDYLEKAEAALQEGDVRHAMGYFGRALRVDPHNPRVWLGLAEAVDDPIKKRECIDHALRLDPLNPRALEALDRLESMTEEALPDWFADIPTPEVETLVAAESVGGLDTTELATDDAEPVYDHSHEPVEETALQPPDLAEELEQPEAVSPAPVESEEESVFEPSLESESPHELKSEIESLAEAQVETFEADAITETEALPVEPAAWNEELEAALETDTFVEAEALPAEAADAEAELDVESAQIEEQSLGNGWMAAAEAGSGLIEESAGEEDPGEEGFFVEELETGKPVVAELAEIERLESLESQPEIIVAEPEAVAESEEIQTKLESEPVVEAVLDLEPTGGEPSIEVEEIEEPAGKLPVEPQDIEAAEEESEEASAPIAGDAADETAGEPQAAPIGAPETAAEGAIRLPLWGKLAIGVCGLVLAASLMLFGYGWAAQSGPEFVITSSLILEDLAGTAIFLVAALVTYLALREPAARAFLKDYSPLFEAVVFLGFTQLLASLGKSVMDHFTNLPPASLEGANATLTYASQFLNGIVMILGVLVGIGYLRNRGTKK